MISHYKPLFFFLSAGSTHLQGHAGDDVQGVHHVAQGLTHLPAVSVPHQGVQQHLVEKTQPQVVW